MNPRAEVNILRAGEFYIYCLWIQGQMTDLISFKVYPDLVEPYLDRPDRVPPALVSHRARYAQLDFTTVRKEFVALFEEDLVGRDLGDLEAIGYLRNVISHSQVSLAREYFLYRPVAGDEHETRVMRDLGLGRIGDPLDPQTLMLRFFDDESYLSTFSRINRLDKVCFQKIAAKLGVPHVRIR